MPPAEPASWSPCYGNRANPSAVRRGRARRSRSIEAGEKLVEAGAGALASATNRHPRFYEAIDPGSKERRKAAPIAGPAELRARAKGDRGVEAREKNKRGDREAQGLRLRAAAMATTSLRSCCKMFPANQVTRRSDGREDFY
jgi:hypothetical protein